MPWKFWVVEQAPDILPLRSACGRQNLLCREFGCWTISSQFSNPTIHNFLSCSRQRQVSCAACHEIQSSVVLRLLDWSSRGGGAEANLHFKGTRAEKDGLCKKSKAAILAPQYRTVHELRGIRLWLHGPESESRTLFFHFRTRP